MQKILIEKLASLKQHIIKVNLNIFTKKHPVSFISIVFSFDFFVSRTRGVQAHEPGPNDHSPSQGDDESEREWVRVLWASSECEACDWTQGEKSKWVRCWKMKWSVSFVKFNVGRVRESFVKYNAGWARVWDLCEI